MATNWARIGEVAQAIHDISYRGKQIPPGLSLEVAKTLDAKGMLSGTERQDGVR